MARKLLLGLLIIASTSPVSSGQLLVSQSMYGINSHLPTDAHLAKMQNGNLAWARMDLNWDQIETSKGSFNWAGVDAAVNSARNRGIRVFATLAYTPAWANGGQTHQYPPTNSEDWKAFVRTAVNRYKATVRHWGLWNEPDLDQFFIGSTSDYINRILIPGAQAIREADPAALRCGPELAGDSDFLEAVLNAAKNYLDVVTLHKYDEQVSEIMRDWDGFRWPWEDPNYKTVLQNTGAWGKAVWFTEVGWPTAYGTHVDTVTEAQQANLYVQLLDEIRQRPWMNKVFFYELKDDPTSGVPAWGVLRADLTEKPAYGAYRDYVSNHPPPGQVTLTDLRPYPESNRTSLAVGSTYFTDRSFTITSMPAYLQGAPGIQTTNVDKSQTSEAWLDFDVDQEADVYVAYDPRATSLPNWLRDHTEMIDTIGLSDASQGYARLYRKTHRIGEAVLGGNMAAGAAGAVSNYFVLTLPAHTGPPDKADGPSPADGATGVNVQARLGWADAPRATSYSVYFGTANPPPLRGTVLSPGFDPGAMAVQTLYYWRVDPANSVGGTRGDIWSFSTGSAPSDFDGDGDVDLEDFGSFQVCYSDGGEPGIPAECLHADLNDDTIVNQADCAVFLACLSGPGIAADPFCAP